MEISELDEPWSYLCLMLILIFFFGLLIPFLSPSGYRNMCCLLMMCHMTVKRPNLEDASQSYIICRGSFSVMSCMERCRDCHAQERKTFYSFNHYIHYTIIKREKRFFSFSHYVHYTMVKREKIFLSSFSHYFHYAMIKRKKDFFILVLRSLHHDQERKKFFFI